MKKNKNDSWKGILVFAILLIYGLILVLSSAKNKIEVIGGIILIIITFLSPWIFWILIYRSMQKDEYMEDKYTSDPIDDTIIKQYIPDFNKEQFLNERYRDFLSLEHAYAKLDYSNLREVLTDELYNHCVMDIDSQKIIGRKMFKDKFKYIKSEIVGINETNGAVKIDVEMFASFKLNSDKTIFIKLFKKYIEHYKITFIMKKNNIENCPSCGAKLNDNSTQICDYCHSLIARTGSKWAMVKIKSISKYAITK